MNSSKLVRWACAGALMILMATMLSFFGSDPDAADASDDKLTFDMIPSNSAISTCLPKARATVTVKNVKNGQIMTLHARGLAPNSDYDFFITQVPHPKFGIAWYQSDLHVDENGNGSATMRGIFSNETFSISLDTLTTNGREDKPQIGAKFGAVNMYHLGLWFNDPKLPFKLGCEPGATAPIVTPFNGEQNAGIQVLNTANFQDNAGPLKQIHP